MPLRSSHPYKHPFTDSTNIYGAYRRTWFHTELRKNILNSRRSQAAGRDRIRINFHPKKVFREWWKWFDGNAGGEHLTPPGRQGCFEREMCQCWTEGGREGAARSLSMQQEGCGRNPEGTSRRPIRVQTSLGEQDPAWRKATAARQRRIWMGSQPTKTSPMTPVQQPLCLVTSCHKTLL